MGVVATKGEGITHTLQQMADSDYGNMHKTLLSTSTLHSLPLRRPQQPHFTFHIPQFRILPIIANEYHANRDWGLVAPVTNNANP